MTQSLFIILFLIVPIIVDLSAHNVCIKELLRRRFANQSSISKHQQQIMSKGLPPKRNIPYVKHIVLVSSGKGGVGKSTTAVNMATALADIQPSLRVGLLDADVFGPSVPLMMNLSGKPLINAEKKMIPMVNYGVKCISMGFLVEQEAAMMWRGLMVMKAVNQLMFEVDWGPTDVLVVDTPPGTGDTHLSLIQNLNISGGLVVTTPQQLATQVAGRGVTMFRKLGVPIIGVVQNMGTVICSNCKHKNELFGPAINKFAKDLDIDVVQDIPLDPIISTSGDQGTPVVISHPDSLVASSFRNLATTVAKFLKIGDFTKDSS
ncbi:iron-sulfur protein NUBPL isoform X2 [Macrosteles quadrilineatus]|uniref:iron-sulfur protein NUBPL isoform X2 n=1 Tax=Macrosteles quadrilineatus TaxID=74068 RepID=UPI0023E147DF|nr:iron-sulfur protein NUBPL isoform X2 [Macrosteles quadrilineatus]